MKTRQKEAVLGVFCAKKGVGAMAEESKKNWETEEYLAKIRRTIAESSRLVDEARLRIAETDRMLEKQGLTREQVMGFQFTDEQREAVNRELARQGMEPLEEVESYNYGEAPSLRAEEFSGYEAPMDNEIEERQRKFGMMMKPFQI